MTCFYQSTQNSLKLIEFNDYKKKQVRKPINDKDIMTNMVHILDDIDNGFLLKNNVEYK